MKSLASEFFLVDGATAVSKELANEVIHSFHLPFMNQLSTLTVWHPILSITNRYMEVLGHRKVIAAVCIRTSCSRLFLVPNSS